MFNSLCVLGLTIGLVVSQPSGGSPAEVNFTVFVLPESTRIRSGSLVCREGCFLDSRGPECRLLLRRKHGNDGSAAT